MGDSDQSISDSIRGDVGWRIQCCNKVSHSSLNYWFHLNADIVTVDFGSMVLALLQRILIARRGTIGPSVYAFYPGFSPLTRIHTQAYDASIISGLKEVTMGTMDALQVTRQYP